jgi:hypothetical protein
MSVSTELGSLVLLKKYDLSENHAEPARIEPKSAIAALFEGISPHILTTLPAMPAAPYYRVMFLYIRS